MDKLNKASIHNLGEEKSVGSIHNELRLLVKGNFEASFEKYLLNISCALLEEECKLSKPRSSTKAFQDIKDKEFEWNQKKKEMEEKGSLKKNMDNMSIEGIKHQDLECNNNPHKERRFLLGSLTKFVIKC